MRVHLKLPLFQEEPIPLPSPTELLACFFKQNLNHALSLRQEEPFILWQLASIDIMKEVPALEQGSLKYHVILGEPWQICDAAYMLASSGVERTSLHGNHCRNHMPGGQQRCDHVSASL